MTDSLPMQPCPHEYGPSRVGHGEAQCKWCLGTNRENAIIAPNHCAERAANDPALSTRPAPASPPGLEGVIAAVVEEAEQACRYVEKHNSDRQEEGDYKEGFSVACDVCEKAIGEHVSRHRDRILAALSPDARVLPIEGEALDKLAESIAANACCLKGLPADPQLDDYRTARWAVHQTAAALRSTPATDEWQQAIEAGVEAIARIIAPHANWDRTVFDDSKFQGDRSSALRKARKIAALKVSHPLQGEGE